MDQQKLKDNSNEMSEECFEEKYRGDSRKWLMRDGTGSVSQLGISSTMRDTYQFPYDPLSERQVIGIKRAQLQKVWIDEVAAEIIEENSKQPPIEEYCTEYDGNYIRPDFDPEAKIDKEKDEQLYIKYPLYASEAASYWKYKIESNVRGQFSLPGLTTAVDMKKPFKKNSSFTKPLSEVLDFDFL